MRLPVKKYESVKKIHLESREWPDCVLRNHPTWCSVDLRDGNQALPVSLCIDKKMELFNLLCGIGFKEIEVGFPSASDTEFSFVRKIIEEKLIPKDVVIQVLTPARECHIKKTIDALLGAESVIIHLYVPISPAHRKSTLCMNKRETVELAVRSTKWIKKYSRKLEDAKVTLQFSPESFSSTEIDFSLQVCREVLNTWQPDQERPLIINLPATVEVSMPNIFADQVEFMKRGLGKNEYTTLSVHTHNDRGTGLAATELGLLAGAERVEGTLLGQGERTGNADIVTLALNLYTKGVDPGLNFEEVEKMKEKYEAIMGMPVHPRHPYVGDLVFTAFSGGHQDAVRKGLTNWEKGEVGQWNVPYLTIDPRDIGRNYESMIRFNGQSGVFSCF